MRVDGWEPYGWRLCRDRLEAAVHLNEMPGMPTVWVWSVMRKQNANALEFVEGGECPTRDLAEVAAVRVLDDPPPPIPIPSYLAAPEPQLLTSVNCRCDGKDCHTFTGLTLPVRASREECEEALRKMGWQLEGHGDTRVSLCALCAPVLH